MGAVSDSETEKPQVTIFDAKSRQRIGLIVANSANTLLIPVFNLAVSLLVIRLTSAELWGGFVSILILVNLAIHFIHWGAKEYLLREFSRFPKEVGRVWRNNVATRATLYGIYALVVLLLDVALLQKLFLMLWGLGGFLYQSFDALILYRRQFIYALVLEVITITALLSVILLRQYQLSVELLIMLFGAALMFKTIGMMVRFRKDVLVGFSASFDAAYFKVALPFFMLGLSGMFQSKTDLYCVAYFLRKEDVGQYQVFINLLIYVQVVSSLILQPFLKNIYRVSQEVIRKIARKLVSMGILISLAGVASIYGVLHWVYHFDFPLSFFFWGLMFILPIYYYLPMIYALYKADHQMKVFVINIIGVAANFGLNMVLLVQIGLLGAVVASAISQWLMLLAYLYYERRLLGGGA